MGLRPSRVNNQYYDHYFGPEYNRVFMNQNPTQTMIENINSPFYVPSQKQVQVMHAPVPYPTPVPVPVPVPYQQLDFYKQQQNRQSLAQPYMSYAQRSPSFSRGMTPVPSQRPLSAPRLAPSYPIWPVPH